MAKQSGTTRSSGSSNPKGNATSSTLVKSIISNGYSKGFRETPISNISYNKSSGTLIVDVFVESRSFVDRNGVTRTTGELGSVKTFKKETGMRGANVTSLNSLSRIGDDFENNGLKVKNYTLREHYVSKDKVLEMYKRRNK